MIIVLNGSAASGKGTLARMIAEHLNLSHYDFGLIFRGIADLRLTREWPAIERLVAQRMARMEFGQFVLNDSILTKRLVTEEAGLVAARLAVHEEKQLVAAAKRFVVHESFVADGRTISQIYPNADWHFQIGAEWGVAQERRRAYRAAI
jgi:CMP/dCMP kinase